MAQVENETSLKLKCLKSDNGSEYYDNRFVEFFANWGIKRVKKVSKNPHQNSVVVYMNMTILERARCMQIHIGLLKQFWTDAVNTIVYLINKGLLVSLNCEILEEARTS